MSDNNKCKISNSTRSSLPNDQILYSNSNSNVYNIRRYTEPHEQYFSFQVFNLIFLFKLLFSFFFLG